MFIGGETLSVYSARSRKIPGSIVPIREHFSVDKRVCRKQTIEIVLRGTCVVFFSNFKLSSYVAYRPMSILVRREQEEYFLG